MVTGRVDDGDAGQTSKDDDRDTSTGRTPTVRTATRYGWLFRRRCGVRRWGDSDVLGSASTVSVKSPPATCKSSRAARCAAPGAR
jgi:hypothetical protein